MLFRSVRKLLDSMLQQVPRKRERYGTQKQCVQARRAVQGSPRMRAETCTASLEPPGRQRGCGEGYHRIESMTDALETHRRQKKKPMETAEGLELAKCIAKQRQKIGERSNPDDMAEPTHKQAWPLHHFNPNPLHAVPLREREKEPPEPPKSLSQTKASFQSRKNEIGRAHV